MERQATDDKPASLSVIVVSDYVAGEEKSWEDLRRALRAWAGQEGKSPMNSCSSIHRDSKARSRAMCRRWSPT